MLYRNRLVLLVALLVTGSVISATTAWWSSGEARRHLHAVRLADEVLAGHLSLAVNASDLFKQFADALLIGDRDRGAGETQLRAAIDKELRSLRELITREVELRGQAEAEELQHLARIERQLFTIEAEFADVQRLRNGAGVDAAWSALTDLLDKRIDSELHGLIQEAIDEERAEVAVTSAEAEQLLARSRILTLAAIAFTLATAAVGLIVLRRALTDRLDRLIAGVRAIAEGHLDHRIGLLGSDEFAMLGTGFDAMAAELQQARSEMQRSQDTLQDEVAARTAELQAANLRLSAHDVARRQFLADISHELRTPITIMRGEAEVALRGHHKMDEEARQALASAVEQADHMGRLVDDLLFVARREAGEARIALRPTPLAPLLESVVQAGRALAREAGVEFRLESNPNTVVVEADPGRLRQLLMVLLDNAVRYSRKGGEVRVRTLTAPQGVVVHVEDDGIGIPETELPHIFDRFVRGSNALAGGTGLGLPVAKAIAEAHGGSLVLESQEGNGTRATLMLPRVNPLRVVA